MAATPRQRDGKPKPAAKAVPAQPRQAAKPVTTPGQVTAPGQVTTPGQAAAPVRRSSGSLVQWGAYVVAFLLGGMEGLIGCFQYSRTVGSAPVAAIGFCVGILATCLLIGWGMRSLAGALVPAIGWIIVSFVLSMPVSGGSVIIASTTPGKWYLYGGSLSAVAGVIAAFALWVRAQQSR